MSPTEPGDDPGIRRSVRVYRALLRVYPRDFRNQYQPGLEQTFRDLARDAARGPEGALFRLWSQTVLDLAWSALQLWAETGSRAILARRVMASALCVSALALFAVGVYTHQELSRAAAHQTFESPESGMIQMYGGPEHVQITDVGAQFRRVRYVVARVESPLCGAGEVRCSVGGYFLEVDDGWVFVPEGWFTALIPAGTRVLDLLNIA